MFGPRLGRQSICDRRVVGGGHDPRSRHGSRLGRGWAAYLLKSVEAVGNSYAGPMPPDARVAAGPISNIGTIVCLGVELDTHGSTTMLFAHRLREVERQWWRWRPQLTASHSPLGERVSLLQSTVISCVLWGSQL